MKHCHVLVITGQCVPTLTLNPLTSTIVAHRSNASKWQMGFNSAFKGLNAKNPSLLGCDATMLDYLTLKMEALRSFESYELFTQRISNTAVTTVKAYFSFSLPCSFQSDTIALTFVCEVPYQIWLLYRVIKKPLCTWLQYKIHAKIF
jgi:hypothetical protein